MVDLRGKGGEDTITLPPVLPYDNSAEEFFELTNNMDVPIEVYSLDFDKKYHEEESILRRMDNFQTYGANEPIFLPLRRPGMDFWPSIRDQDKKKTAFEGVKAQIQACDDKLKALDDEVEAYNEYYRLKKEQEDAPAEEVKS